MDPANKTGSKLARDFQIQKLLGTGSFGAVLQCQNSKDKLTYAIKVTGALDVNSMREVENLIKIPSHKNLVHYYTCWKDELNPDEISSIKKAIRLDPSDGNKFSILMGQTSLRIICIQMELCSQDLRNWLSQSRRKDDISSTTAEIFLQICSGLEHIHYNGIIHRDLKPENIFLTKGSDGLNVKIGDLGIATGHLGEFSANHTSASGTRLYFAPEQERSRYGKTVDIYALGIILFELLNPSIQPGLNGGSFDKLIASVTELKFKQTIPFLIKSRWPEESDLILKLTSVNPYHRPNFETIREVFEKASKAQEIVDVSNPFKSPRKPTVLELMGGPKPYVSPFKNAAKPAPFNFKPIEELVKKEVNPEMKPSPLYKPPSPIKPVNYPKANHGEHLAAPKDYKPLKAEEVLKPVVNPALPVRKPVFGPEFNKPYEASPNENVPSPPKYPPPPVFKPVVAPNKVPDPPKYPPPPVIKPVAAPGNDVPALPKYPPLINKPTASPGKGQPPKAKPSATCYTCKKAITVDQECPTDKTFCQDCLQKLGVDPFKCAKCQRAIQDGTRYRIFKDQKFHVECIKCSHCRKNILPDERCFEKEDELYCVDCHTKLFCPKCFSCKKYITGTITTFEDGKWHEDCFKCHSCKTVIRKGEKVFSKDNAVYCIPCKDEKFAPRCLKCKKPITEKHTVYKNDAYHNECFRCFNCNAMIGSCQFYPKDNKFYCIPCKTDIFSPRCIKCSKPITTEHTVYKNEPWHPECFVCSKCFKPISGQKFYVDGNYQVCVKCNDR